MSLWFLAACGSALFAGLTSVLAKIGLTNTDSTVATAIRTGVVLVMAWLAAALAGKVNQVFTLSKETWIFLVAALRSAVSRFRELHRHSWKAWHRRSRIESGHRTAHYRRARNGLDDGSRGRKERAVPHAGAP